MDKNELIKYEESKKVSDELNDFISRQAQALAKRDQNKPVIVHNEIHNYYGETGKEKGLLERAIDTGAKLLSNPAVAGIALTSTAYIGGKVIGLLSGNKEEESNDVKKLTTDVDEELEPELIKESKNTKKKSFDKNSSHISCYSNKSIFGEYFQVIRENDSTIRILSDDQILTNYLNRINEKSVAFNSKSFNLEDAIRIILKDIIKLSSIENIIFVEGDNEYDMYVNGDINKEFLMRFILKEEKENE